MSLKEFKRQYECEFKPDPLLQEVVVFLRTASFKQIAEAKRNGLITSEMYKEAKRIIDRGLI